LPDLIIQYIAITEAKTGIKNRNKKLRKKNREKKKKKKNKEKNGAGAFHDSPPETIPSLLFYLRRPYNHRLGRTLLFI
jgi:hypothetical protein